MKSHRLLIIGVGSIGERHVRCFQRTERCELSICETVEERRRDVANRYRVTHAFASVDEALDGGSYDAAVVATPAPFHVPLALRLAESGLHLLIEKPLSLNMDGVEELRGLVRDRERCVAVGYMHRAHPAVMGVKKALESERFGSPLEIQIHCGQPFAALRPAYRDIYFANPALGGGAISDMITHFYSVGEWLAGPIDRIVTDAGHQSLEGVTVEDTVHSLTRHGAVMGSYTLNLYQKANEVVMRIICQKGSCRVEYARRRWSWIAEDGGRWNHVPVEVPDTDSFYLRQNVAFLDAMEGKGKPFCDLGEAIQTLRVNLASKRSLETGSWESVR